MGSRRIYRHFCMMARALEVVGERWSLLIVRDLLLGPRRFTDLARSLAEITPTRLTNRLRQLEAAGIVVREPPSAGREVWYRLTESGRDLGPAVEALALWGVKHAFEPPLPGEPVAPAPVMIGTKVWLSRQAARPVEPVAWVWRFGGDESYTLRFDGTSWVLTREDAKGAAVIVEATLEAWAGFLTAPVDQRRLPAPEIRVSGEGQAVDDFAKAFGVSSRQRRRP